ncbi:PEP-CTERM sorting domain-containing protein [Parasalinivibrio latis]|uniref:PEP-CTERM sorting domain-containing protein n=1 Tax=Parasalinivibrio latis TaxID=2952610 RepID=UPI0030E100EB
MYKKALLSAAVAGSMLAVAPAAFAAPIVTDIVSVIDESGSMGGEQAWLSGMISQLDGGLSAAAGADPLSVQYGLVGFGASIAAVRRLDMDTTTAAIDDWGTATQMGPASGNLVASGATEDGYLGVNEALSYSGQAGGLRNIILITDEDRDNTDFSLTYASVLSALQSADALLNAVLNVDIRCGDGSTALGIDADGNGYQADGAGSYNTCSGASILSGAGSSIADYADMATATGGAVWDLNQLRVGGLTATSFTDAFVDLKVRETVVDPDVPVPEPATLFLFAGGLGMAGWQLRKKS